MLIDKRMFEMIKRYADINLHFSIYEDLKLFQPRKITLHTMFNGLNFWFSMVSDSGQTKLMYLHDVRFKNPPGLGITSYAIPTNLTHLELSKYFSPDLILPHTITHLKLRSPNQFQLDNLPRNLTHLSCTFTTRSLVLKDTLLPSSLVYLYLDGEFNSSIDNFPKSITHIFLGNRFDQTIDQLPSSLTHLCIGNAFNQTVNNVPQSLTHLILGSSFNKAIKITANLMVVDVGFKFNYSIAGLPNSVQYLRLGPKFKRSMKRLPKDIVLCIASDTCDLVQCKHSEKVKTYTNELGGYNDNVPKIFSPVSYLTII